jgi:ABC-type lipoprotein release transport system permease subunit
LTLAAVSTILMITAAVAAFLPARRASHVDPRIALN